ncbi:pilZ domain protein [Geobacter sp. OR-1]|uniref:PilZ-like domain-containing protein n=1 Tax=Geobacter sp. OR-1 TaxID=1266765 RepID=UPI0005425BA8|nr:PilZ-like domain-containing protein [Geobacter sp. OR-1]GAM08443.1 pilZ domain protein [Geobacter sp. OR-1]
MEAKPVIDYSQYYQVGGRVGIDIPLANGTIFREWGIIIEMEQDYLQLRLSRDILPQEMKIEVGTIFLLVTGKEGAGLCCRAIVVAESSRRVVPLRLISEVLIYERRNFFRIATYLPMAWQSCRSLSGREIREQWEDARLFRAWHWSELNEAVPMMKPLTQDQLSRFQQMRESLKVKLQPLAANISGNGIRLKLPQPFQVGDRLALQFFIPFSKPNILEVVAEVVWTAPVISSSSVEPFYYTAMQFYFIDERDRENIIRFISLEQLQQIQQLNGNQSRPLPEDVPLLPEELARRRLRKILSVAVFLVVLAALAAWLIPILKDYYSGKSERNLIEQSFDKGIKQYRSGKGANGE